MKLEIIQLSRVCVCGCVHCNLSPHTLEAQIDIPTGLHFSAFHYTRETIQKWFDLPDEDDVTSSLE